MTRAARAIAVARLFLLPGVITPANAQAQHRTVGQPTCLIIDPCEFNLSVTSTTGDFVIDLLPNSDTSAMTDVNSRSYAEVLVRTGDTRQQVNEWRTQLLATMPRREPRTE